jgi:hypothetical protein
MTNHYESCRGSGYAFLAKSTFCVSLFGEFCGRSGIFLCLFLSVPPEKSQDKEKVVIEKFSNRKI